ncbi:MAG: zinc metallopeptidase [Clostridiales bacterium]|nr:MAG: zinc metallopeptidase [Clostridiales bacterium]
MFWDPTMVLLIPAMILAMYAQMKVNSTYHHYSQIASQRGMTGADVARYILNKNGLYDIPIERVQGQLSDHYDPRSRVVRLSQGVYDSTSIAALGVAAHEVGHAIQHDTGYMPLYIRNTIIPITQIGSYVSIPLLILGILVSSPRLVELGILLFTAIVFFQLITLPVEFNASRRAVAVLGDEAILTADELVGTKKVLSAAALTYVAAAVTAVFQLLRLLIISGVLGGRDD